MFSFLYKCGAKQWPRSLAKKYVGDYESVFFTYASDDNLRKRSASGGSVSALLIHMLDSEYIDGALVVRTVIENGKARPCFEIATNRVGVLSGQGSKYAAVKFVQHAMALIREFPGKLAVVALPCDAKIVRHACQRDDKLDNKIRCVISLVCGHNSEPALTDKVVGELGNGHGELVDLQWRSGHWRGKMTADFEDGQQVAVPFSRFSNYRNLYFFAQRKCHYCNDHYGYYCDISAGDIWSAKMRKEPIKHTALIVRSERGREIVASAFAAAVVTGREDTLDEVLNGQSRTMPFHYNVSARAKVAPLFGMKIKDTVGEQVRIVDLLVALICMTNESVSRTRVGRCIIFAMPRPLVRAYLYFFKLLELV